MNDFLQAAFDEVCKDAKEPQGFYVSLMESAPFFGGPEEGGWWGSDVSIAAYQWFATEEQANAAKEAVQKLASEMSADARRAFGQQCLNEMKWLDARGLDADYFREPDGESTFYVLVSEGLPEESRGCRQYS